MPLRPKALALLQELLGRPGKLLLRDELLGILWPDTTVSDDSLTQCVSDLRQAFGHRAAQILRTIPRRGYVLAAEVEETVVPSPASGSVNERCATIVLTGPASFDIQLDPDSRSLAAMLITDLATELAFFEDMRIVPTGTPAASHAFRVVVEVRRASVVHRVSLRLESRDGGLLWADRYEVPHGSAQELDARHLGQLAVQIMRHVNREDLRQARSLPIGALTTRQLCLMGQDLHRHGTEPGTVAALEMLSRATERDPAFATPHALLSYSVQRAVTHGWGGGEPEAARQRSLALAQRAVQLEPGSAFCLARLAFALLLHERWEEAIATARAAVLCCRQPTWEALAPAGEVLVYGGHAAEATLLLRQVLAQDTLSPATARAVLGRALLLADQPEEALPELRWCTSQLPDYSPCLNSLVVAAVETGRMEEARAALAEVHRIEALWPPSKPNGRWLLRHDKDRERFRRAFAAAAARP